MNPAEPQLEHQIAHNWPVSTWTPVTVIVGVSGGPDSVALLRCLHRIRPTSASGRLVVGHVNHRMRGPDSDADQQFVERLADDLQISCHSFVVSQTLRSADGVQAQCRTERIAFFKRLSAEIGARFVATAHSYDDQVETTLFRIFRGTGLKGLAGIPRYRALTEGTTLVRPMLSVRRTDVCKYLKKIGQEYRTDCSNQSVEYSRNWIRHELLPKLRAEFRPSVDDAVFRLAELAGQHTELIDTLVAPIRGAITLSSDASTMLVECSPLCNWSDAVVIELIIRVWEDASWPRQSMTSRHWDQLAKLVRCPPETGQNATFPGNIHAARHGDQLVLSRHRC